MNALKREVVITIHGKQVIAPFPSIIQALKIEELKQILTNGRYALMSYSMMTRTEQMLDIADMIAYFGSTIKGFYDLVGIKNAIELGEKYEDEDIIVELMKQYKEIYKPFFDEIYERKDRPAKEEVPNKEEDNTSKDEIKEEQQELATETADAMGKEITDNFTPKEESKKPIA